MRHGLLREAYLQRTPTRPCAGRTGRSRASWTSPPRRRGRSSTGAGSSCFNALRRAARRPRRGGRGPPRRSRCRCCARPSRRPAPDRARRRGSRAATGHEGGPGRRTASCGRGFDLAAPGPAGPTAGRWKLRLQRAARARRRVPRPSCGSSRRRWGRRSTASPARDAEHAMTQAHAAQPAPRGPPQPAGVEIAVRYRPADGARAHRRRLARRLPRARRGADRRRGRRGPGTTSARRRRRWRSSATSCAAWPSRTRRRRRRPCSACSTGRCTGSPSAITRRRSSPAWSRSPAGTGCAGRTRATRRRCSSRPTAARRCSTRRRTSCSARATGSRHGPHARAAGRGVRGALHGRHGGAPPRVDRRAPRMALRAARGHAGPRARGDLRPAARPARGARRGRRRPARAAPPARSSAFAAAAGAAATSTTISGARTRRATAAAATPAARGSS